MTPSGTINEYNTINNELGSITLLDLVRAFNERNSLLPSQQTNGYGGMIQNELHGLLDIIAKHFGYYDRMDMKSQNAYNYGEINNGRSVQNLRNDINSKISIVEYDVNNFRAMMQTLAKMYGYNSIEDFISQNKNVTTANINQNETLLHIDRMGNVKINGQVENNPTRIGREILKLASIYKDNFVIKNAADYFNEPLDKWKNEADAPF